MTGVSKICSLTIGLAGLTRLSFYTQPSQKEEATEAALPVQDGQHWVERQSEAFNRQEAQGEPCNGKSAVRQKPGSAGPRGHFLEGRAEKGRKALLAEPAAHSGESSEVRRSEERAVAFGLPTFAPCW